MAQRGDGERILRTDFEDTLSVLGSMGKRAVLAELESKHAYSAHSAFLEVHQVTQCLVPLFGVSATQLLMRQSLVKKCKVRT